MSKKSRSKNYLKLRDPKESFDFGRLVAEQDSDLAQYYVAQERYVDRAMSFADPATFFVGPKGVGKSAILQMVRLKSTTTGSRVIDIRPDDLAFSALANAQATSRFVGEATQHQWLFKVCWDYVLSLEVLKQEFPDSAGLTGWFDSLLGGQYKKEARKLIAMSEGSDVTLTERILQLIKELEVSGEYSGVKLAGKVGIEQAKGADSGNSLQLLSLVNSVAKRLRDNLSHRYYLLIDDLDLYWENSPTQNAFIAALFSSLSHLSRPPTLKAAVALRQNIYDSIPLVDRDKFHDFVCQVQWDHNSVRSILEQRICFKLQLTTKEVWGGLFDANAFETIWQNTNGRPREAIRLASIAASTASRNGHDRVLSEDLHESVRQFSNERIREHSGEIAFKYPGLEQVIRKMSGWPKEFPYSKLEQLVEQLDFEIQMKEPWADRYTWVGGFANNVKGFVQIMLESGVLWIKQSRTDAATPYDPQFPCEVTNERWFAIHPMFAPGLGLVGA